MFLVFFNSVKKIIRLRKEINSLLSKKMSNIYVFKLILRKTDVLKTSQISLNFEFSSKKSEVWEQHCVFLFYILILKGIMTF